MARAVAWLLPAAVGAALWVPPPAATPAPPGPSRSVLLRDPACFDPTLLTSDCLSVTAESDREGVRFTVVLAAELVKGGFTCVQVFLDCDDNEATGIGGHEVWFRAAVGSRFRPNDAKPAAPGEPAPLDVRLLSWSENVTQENLDGGAAGKSWMNHPLEGAPEVEGATLRFLVPARILSRGTEWASPEIAFRVAVETWAGDQPLVVDHAARDDGLPIVVDGDDGDWSGGAQDTDPGGELPPLLRHVDLVRLRVDHEGRRLLACVEMQGSGFAEALPATKDVTRAESITLLAEPADAEYDAPRRLVVRRGKAKGTGPDGEWAVFGRILEVALPRTGLEGRTRVLAWSEATRRDAIPDQGSARIARPGR